jgi:hypothetical protein
MDLTILSLRRLPHSAQIQTPTDNETSLSIYYFDFTVCGMQSPASHISFSGTLLLRTKRLLPLYLCKASSDFLTRLRFSSISGTLFQLGNGGCAAGWIRTLYDVTGYLGGWVLRVLGRLPDLTLAPARRRSLAKGMVGLAVEICAVDGLGHGRGGSETTISGLAERLFGSHPTS